MKTYSELLTRISEMPGLEAAPAWQFVMDAEADLRGIQHFRMDQRVRVRMAARSGTLALPDDFLELRSITQGGEFIRPMSARQINSSGDTRYRITGESITVDPAPQSATEFWLVYRARIPTLSEAEPTNWLLREFPMVLYHSAMVHAYEWLKDTEGENASRNRAGEAIALLQADHKKGQYGGNTPVLGV